MSARAREQQRVQLSLSALLIAQVRRLWNGSPRPLVPLVEEFAPISALNAAEWYEDIRAGSSVRTPFRVSLAPSPPLEQITRSLDWANKGDDGAAILTKVEGVVDKLVTDVGRDTVTSAVAEDKEALGYARYARPGACYFCALLATRGAVYKTEMAAEISRHGKAFHDHCHCVAEPLFVGADYEAEPHIQKWDSLYRSSTGHVSGAEKVREFRRAFEGRDRR